MQKYNAYHTDVKLAFICGILPEEITQQIPNSTQHSWKYKDLSSLVYLGQNNQDIHEKVDVMKKVLNSKRMYNIIKVLVRINTILNKAIENNNRSLSSFKEQIIQIVDRFQDVVPKKRMLSWLKITPHKFAFWKRNKKNCNSSIVGLCRRRHPNQLALKEVKVIQKYLSFDPFSAWPLRSIYGFMMRKDFLDCSLSTFYNKAGLKSCFNGLGSIESLSVTKFTRKEFELQRQARFFMLTSPYSS